MKTTNVLSALLAMVLAAPGATIIGVNFNNNDSAGAQAGGDSFGAIWTDVNADNVTGLALNGTPGATLDLAANGWWQAGSWTGTDGMNSEISLFRIYLNDNGISLTVHGLQSWMTSESAAGYQVTIYSSTDNGTSFKDVNVAGTMVPILAGGNGTWNGAFEDVGGNDSGGLRGSGTSGLLTDDELTITLDSHSFPVRSTLAGFTITAVPEPGVAMLGMLGLGALVAGGRRRA
ncbi:PEP-CTERM sorting domain-containing protein [Haloferula sargassicola]